MAAKGKYQRTGSWTLFSGSGKKTASAKSKPVKKAPVKKAPAKKPPAKKPPVKKAPVERTPVERTPVRQTPVEAAPVERTPVQQAPVERIPAEAAPVTTPPVEAAPVEKAPEKKPAAKKQPAQPQETAQPVLSPGRKVWEAVKTVLTYTIVVLSMAMMLFTAVSVTTLGRNDRSLFGFKAFIVRSDSMSATDFSAGDLVIVQNTDPSTLEPGDIISFLSEDPESMGETFTHKIRRRTTLGGQEPAFITYGTTNDIDDPLPVTYSKVIGKYCFAIPHAGTFFAFMKTTPGYICCIFLPFLLLLIIQGSNSIRLAGQMYQEKKEEVQAEHQAKLDELTAQQEALEAQRRQIQEAMEELRSLKEQMGAQPPQEPL